MKNKAIVLVQQRTDLFVCSFCTDHSNSDYDLIEDARFHFEERVGAANIEAHAEYSMIDFFDKEEQYKIHDIIDLSE